MALANQPVNFITLDFYSEAPVSDEVFAAFQELYAYDDLPVAAQIEAVGTFGGWDQGKDHV